MDENARAIRWAKWRWWLLLWSVVGIVAPLGWLLIKLNQQGVHEAPKAVTVAKISNNPDAGDMTAPEILEGQASGGSLTSTKKVPAPGRKILSPAITKLVPVISLRYTTGDGLGMAL